MIKVLHFFKTYLPDTMGGIEQVIFQLAEGGAKYGIESQVLYLSDRGPASNQQVGHHIAHRVNKDIDVASTGMSIAAFKVFKDLAREADIIHYHFPWPFMDVVHFLTGLKKPSVVTYHSDIVKQKTLMRFYRPLMERFLSSVNVIVASSPNYIESSKVLSQFKGKVRVVPFGLDRNTYPPINIVAQKALYQKFGNRFFLFLGALRYYKGLKYLIEAAAHLNCPIVIAGSGPYGEELKKRASDLHLKNVFFLGRVTDEEKVQLLSSCLAMVFPSHLRSEAFGISLLEAAMYGKPMISCEIGTGTSFINVHRETGLVIAPENVQQLVAAMNELWSSEALCTAMGDNARNRALEHFSIEKMLGSYAEIYQDCMSSGPNSIGFKSP